MRIARRLLIPALAMALGAMAPVARADATASSSVMTLTGPSSSAAGVPVTLDGTLELATGTPVADAPVTVQRSTSGGAPVALAAATTDSNGDFAVTDIPPAAGDFTYTASYGGDTSSAASQATAMVTAYARTAAITLSGPSSVVHDTSFTISGTLVTVPAASSDYPATISVVRTNPDHTTTSSTVTTAVNGTFTLTGTLTTLGAYSYAMSYQSPTTLPALTTYTVVVVNPAPTLSLDTGHGTVLYGSAITVTAHLGVAGTDRTVSIRASFPGSRTVKVLKTAGVDSAGDIVVRFPDAVRDVVFTATFGGDAQYAATSVSERVGVDARVAVSASGWYASAPYDGTAYRVYHHTGAFDAAIAVTPNKRDECVHMNTQALSGGRWTGDDSACFHLSDASRQALYLALSGLPYARYRVQAVFVPSSADVTNVGYYSGWFYFEVVK